MKRGLGRALRRLRAWVAGPGVAEGLKLETSGPLELPGPWPRGMALDTYSRSEGYSEGEKTEVGDLLSRFKYGGEGRLGRVLGGALASALGDDPGYREVEVVTHIPATRRRRGPDAACELATVVARGLGVRCLPRLMARARRTALQKDVVEWAEKKENVAGAFRVRRAELVRGRKVLLVDDVYDSGATLEEGWRVLMEAGAREVVVATVARTWYWRDAERWNERPGSR
jgi:hypothetical protein